MLDLKRPLQWSLQPAEEKISALKIFIMGLRSPESKNAIHERWLISLDFLKLPGATLEEQCEAFIELANKNGISGCYIVCFSTENITRN